MIVLSSLDFFVVQDIFLSKTAQYADVILPAAHLLKKKERLQIQNAVYNDYIKYFSHLGDSKPDWWIVQEIANRLGANWNYNHPSEIYA